MRCYYKNMNDNILENDLELAREGNVVRLHDAEGAREDNVVRLHDAEGRLGKGGLQLLCEGSEANLHVAGLQLVRQDGVLYLQGGGMQLCVDFLGEARRLRPDALARELLVRAARVRGAGAPVVVDATAGLGEDALLLAAAGAQVYMFEKNEVIAALLADGISRALEGGCAGAAGAMKGGGAEKKSAALVAQAASRMHLSVADSVSALRTIAGARCGCAGMSGEAAGAQANINPDVIYLDPMFPARSKSAAVKKKFQLLHKLELPCENERELLEAALLTSAKKVVIKRPLKGAFLADMKPSYSLKGKAVRYDVIAKCR